MAIPFLLALMNIIKDKQNYVIQLYAKPVLRLFLKLLNPDRTRREDFGQIKDIDEEDAEMFEQNARAAVDAAFIRHAVSPDDQGIFFANLTYSNSRHRTRGNNGYNA